MLQSEGHDVYIHVCTADTCTAFLSFIFTKLQVSNFSYLKGFQEHMDIQKESLRMPANEKRKIRKKEKKSYLMGY